ncbi:hypothetical protein SAMN06297129_0968 [Pseudooceanicola antarcticus]|uniref:Uncharacterized protein n=1 Tax=Pseudooceanicola antarcticus TaxID=1247613 RepID=A0A285IHC1_9RHOB|nr:hypothetical protein [Pseudooceanicola antarcticus]SNY46476.1 hypothetical protein SAMN06297129_0968 [Pseudooceanicola antarcticus]
MQYLTDHIRAAYRCGHIILSRLWGSRRSLLAIILVLGIFLVWNGAERSKSIEEAYGDTVANLGLIPVYPPREDIRVGDVFFVSHDGDPRDARIVLVHRIDSQDLVERYLKDIPAYEQTVLDGGKVSLAQADLQNENVVAARSEVPTFGLPVAAFPDITGVSSSSIAARNGRVLGFLGAGAAREVRETLSFETVRTYAAYPEDLWLELTSFLKKSDEECVKFRCPSGGDDCAETAIPLCTGEANSIRLGVNLLRATESFRPESRYCKGENVCSLYVVTRLYLTREIRYTYSGSVSGYLGDPEISTADSIDVGNPNLDAANRKESAVRIPVSASHQQSQGVGYSTVFPRPLVIAWEGLSFTFDADEVKSVLDSMN